jgi:exopolysaccharide production protein ExoY
LTATELDTEPAGHGAGRAAAAPHSLAPVATPAPGPLLITVQPLPSRLLKRSVDLGGAIVLLFLLAPPMAVLALVIRRDGAPAVYRHRRVGRDGVPFDVLKFRSMAADAEWRLRADPELYARYCANGFKLRPEEDPRITRFGRFLRSSSLDELPQLLNVIAGSMSLVGPRPVVAAELREYEARGGAAAYLSVRPGMTGEWQVGGRSHVGYDGRVAMDIDYVANLGLRRDLRILFRTVGAVLRRAGAH